MKKYKLLVNGTIFDGSAHKLTDLEVQKLNKYKTDNSINKWEELYDDLEDLVEDYDRYETNWWNAERIMVTPSLNFVLLDEANNLLWTKKHEEISDIYDLADKYNIEDGFDDIEKSFDAVPYEDQENILFVYELLKGDYCSFEIDSEEIPNIEDFAIVSHCLETPDEEFEFLEKVFYKNIELDPNYDDQFEKGKLLVVELFTMD
jgi:hypothetical protein